MECICIIQVEQSGRISLDATIVSLQTQLSRLTQQAEFGTLLKSLGSMIVYIRYIVLLCFVVLQMSKKGTVQCARYPTVYSRSHFDTCFFLQLFYLCCIQLERLRRAVADSEARNEMLEDRDKTRGTDKDVTGKYLY